MTQNGDGEPSFSLHDFRKWLERNEPQPERKERPADRVAESRLGERRLGPKILEANPQLTEDQADEYARVFIANGAEVLKTDMGSDETLWLRLSEEVRFVLPRIYVRVKRQDG